MIIPITVPVLSSLSFRRRSDEGERRRIARVVMRSRSSTRQASVRPGKAAPAARRAAGRVLSRARDPGAATRNPRCRPADDRSAADQTPRHVPRSREPPGLPGSRKGHVVHYRDWLTTMNGNSRRGVSSRAVRAWDLFNCHSLRALPPRGSRLQHLFPEMRGRHRGELPAGTRHSAMQKFWSWGLSVFFSRWW